MAVHTFIFSEESVNRHGYRILTDGIDITNYEKNPVVLYMHQDSRLPIGKAVKVWKEEGKLKADVEFDMNDEFAASVADKVENGFISGTSIWIEQRSRSSEESDMLPGQIYPTVTSSELMELSIVTVQGNGKCYKLSGGKEGLKLGLDASKSDVKKYFGISHEGDENNDMEKELILSALGVTGEMSDTEVIGKITSLKNKNLQLSAKISEMEEEKKTSRVDLLLSVAVKKGKLTKEQLPLYKKLALADFESTKEVIEGMESYTPPMSSIEKPEGTHNPDLAKKYLSAHQSGGFDNLPQAEQKELESAYLQSLKEKGVVA